MNNRMTLLILLFCVAAHSIPVVAQNSLCGFDMMYEEALKSNPSLRDSLAKYENQIQAIIKDNHSSLNRNNATYTIPVVVHVIHLGEAIGTGSNIADTIIYQAIDGLNERFSNTIGSGINTDIQFCLAVRDPEGKVTIGINRVDGSAVPDYTDGVGSCGAESEDVKDLSKWPTDEYYNFWVVYSICGGYSGYASLPSSYNEYDGTVIRYTSMTYNSGTPVHEVGHGLNLHHTHKGDDGTVCPDNTDCSIDGDLCCDTPPHKRGDCGATNPCDASGIWDNSRKNYLSYCSLSVTDERFTQDQTDRMIATLQVDPRLGLLSSIGCVPVPPNDAGIYEMLYRCDSLIEVIFKNYGSNIVDSVIINWSVNDTLHPSFAWTGSLAHFDTDTVILGNYPSSYLKGSDFKIWTTNPNGVSDTNKGNDTLAANDRYLGLAGGTYTIGGSSPDFNSIQAAFNVLSGGGICGSVTFNIRDNTYNQQIVIEHIPGSSALQTITFQSESGDSSAVVLTYTSTSSDTNYVLKLNGADHMVIKQITFKAGGSSYGGVVVIENGSNNNQFLNCSFEGIANKDNLVYSSGSTDSNLVFLNNTFLDGFRGLRLYGEYELLETGTIIQHNRFEGQKGGTALELLYQDSPNILNNTINDTRTAIQIQKCDNQMRIIGNKFSNITRLGIYNLGCDADSGKECIIANNFIHMVNGDGIYNQGSTYQSHYHNSIIVTGTNTSMSPFYNTGGGSNLIVVNNIFANYTGGYAVNYSSLNDIALSDHNNYYSSGSILGYWSQEHATLSDVLSVTLQDSNSISVPPLFVSDTNLHVCRAEFDGSGTPISMILDDIDGDSRDGTNPDMGADEFTVAVISVFGSDTTVCTEFELNSIPGYSNYMWSNGSATESINVTETNNYYLTFTDTSGCSFYSDSIYITVKGISVSLGNDISLVQGESVALDAGSGYSSYLWNDGSTSQTITVNSSSLDTISYTYYVTVDDTNNCSTSDTIMITIKAPTGILNNIDNSRISIYPNPNSGELTIEIQTDSNEELQISLSNISGQVIFSKIITGSYSSKIDLRGYAKGIYSLKVVGEDVVLNRKVIYK